MAAKATAGGCHRVVMGGIFLFLSSSPRASPSRDKNYLQIRNLQAFKKKTRDELFSQTKITNSFDMAMFPLSQDSKRVLALSCLSISLILIFCAAGAAFMELKSTTLPPPPTSTSNFDEWEDLHHDRHKMTKVDLTTWKWSHIDWNLFFHVFGCIAGIIVYLGFSILILVLMFEIYRGNIRFDETAPYRRVVDEKKCDCVMA